MKKMYERAKPKGMRRVARESKESDLSNPHDWIYAITREIHSIPYIS